MDLHDTQKIAASDLHRFRVVNCGRRWGKSTFAILEMVAGAYSLHDSRFCYIAPTFQQVRDIAWAELVKICQPIISKSNESRLELDIINKHKTTSKIMLRSWEAIETLRGQKFDMIIIDEVAMVKNFKENWQQVIRPTLTDRRGTGLFLSTPKGFNHWYDLYNMEQQDRDYKSFTFTTYDNPHIPIDEIEKAKLELTEDAFAQEYMGDFRKHTGLVFKDFDRKVHVKDFDIKPKYQMYCGQDFGWKNPTVVLYSYFDDDDVWYIFDEYYQTELPVDQHAGRIQAKRMQYHNVLKVVYGDSEDPQQIREYQNYNWYITPVIKGSDSILTGIGRIEERLKINAITKEPRMYIHPKCTNLISELERYRWQSNRDPDLNQKETPEKAFDHAIDAMRYIINSYVKEQKKPTPLQGRPVRPIMYVPMGGVRPPQKKKKLPFTLLY